MASVEAVTMTESALAEQVKVFITRFRKNGQYTYVDKIDAMMPKRIKAAVIDYNDLVAYPMLDSMFNENPDRILRAFSAAIGEILYERFPDYAIKIRDDIRARIVNYPVQRSLREINAEIINKMTSVSGMIVRASEVKPLAKELTYICPEGHTTVVILIKS